MPIQPSRRRTLQQLAALGLLGPAGIAGLISEVLAAGDKPPVPGINRVEGKVAVNGVAAKVGTPVKVGDKVTTGPRSATVVVVDGDAFLLRDNTTIEFKGSSAVDTLILATGRVLSVFSKRKDAELRMNTRHGVIGVRGTAMYVECVEAERTYFCLCYGEAAITGKGMSTPTVLKTFHHEAPVWIDDSGSAMKVVPGPFLNHTDEELILLEALVGRKPPFLDSPFETRKYNPG